MFLGQGAAPIFRGGALIDDCGVGGGTAQEDEDCARAGWKISNKVSDPSSPGTATVGGN